MSMGVERDVDDVPAFDFYRIGRLNKVSSECEEKSE